MWVVRKMLLELSQFKLNKEIGVLGPNGYFIPIKEIVLSSDGKVLIVPQYTGERKGQ